MLQVIDGPYSAQSPWERQSGQITPQNQRDQIGGTQAPIEMWDPAEPAGSLADAAVSSPRSVIRPLLTAGRDAR